MHLFLSWSGEIARSAAKGFYEWARRVFPEQNVRIYFSEKSNEPGSLWRQVLKSALKDASVGVFFLTQESIASPWVLFEAGAISTLPQSRIFMILLDLSSQELARMSSPFGEYQAMFPTPDDIWKLVETMATSANTHRSQTDQEHLRMNFNQWCPRFLGEIEEAKSAEFSKGNWQRVTRASVASRINDSPFEARHLFRIAKQRLDFVAQNHHFMTVQNPDEHLDSLREFLKDHEDRIVTFLAMDPQEQNAVSSWMKLMDTKHFPDDLRASLTTLSRWQVQAQNEMWKGKLDIRLTGLLPISYTFFDPEDITRGGLVLTPMGRHPSNLNRPAFLLTSVKNDDAFFSYRTMWMEQFQRARKL